LIESTLELASVHKGWDHHHHLLREAVRPLSVDQLALRAALQWAVGHGRGEIALRMGIALERFWVGRCLHNEGLAFLERALAGSAA
jgi:predicted ATPase